MAFLNWLLDRLQEDSTWRGIIQLVTSFGIVVDPDMALYVISVGTGLIGVINFVRKQHTP